MVCYFSNTGAPILKQTDLGYHAVALHAVWLLSEKFKFFVGNKVRNHEFRRTVMKSLKAHMLRNKVSYAFGVTSQLTVAYRPNSKLLNRSVDCIKNLIPQKTIVLLSVLLNCIVLLH